MASGEAVGGEALVEVADGGGAFPGVQLGVALFDAFDQPDQGKIRIAHSS